MFLFLVGCLLGCVKAMIRKAVDTSLTAKALSSTDLIEDPYDDKTDFLQQIGLQDNEDY